MSLHIERQILLPAARKQFPLNSKEAAQRDQGLYTYFIYKFITEIAVPTSHGCSSPEELSADSQTTPPDFLSLFFLLLLLVFLAGLFQCLSSSSRFLPKLSFNTLGKTQSVLKECKIHVGEREWEDKKSCYFWFTDEVLQCRKSNSEFLEVNARIHFWLPAGQAIIPVCADPFSFWPQVHPSL